MPNLKGDMPVGNLIIELYIPERDKASITAMLCENERVNVFQQSDKTLSDAIFVARYNDVTVAFLSFDGFRRRAMSVKVHLFLKVIFLSGNTKTMIM